MDLSHRVSMASTARYSNTYAGFIRRTPHCRVTKYIDNSPAATKKGGNAAPRTDSKPIDTYSLGAETSCSCSFAHPAVTQKPRGGNQHQTARSRVAHTSFHSTSPPQRCNKQTVVVCATLACCRAARLPSWKENYTSIHGGAVSRAMRASSPRVRAAEGRQQTKRRGRGCSASTSRFSMFIDMYKLREAFGDLPGYTRRPLRAVPSVTHEKPKTLCSQPTCSLENFITTRYPFTNRGRLLNKLSG